MESGQQFLLFAGDDYYPRGGIKDLQSSHADLPLAQSAVTAGSWDWWHIVDTTDMAIVESSTT